MSSFQLRANPLIPYSIFVVILFFIVGIHLYFLIPGVDAGLHMYGALLIAKGHFPYADLWNNKPPLIYVIGTCGFILKSNPFLGVRIFEILIFFTNLLLLFRVVKMTGQRDNTKFLLPLFESNDYSESYKKNITEDFEHPPTFLVFNKISYKYPNPADFYMQTINRALKKYVPVFENEQYEVFKLSQQ